MNGIGLIHENVILFEFYNLLLDLEVKWLVQTSMETTMLCSKSKGRSSFRLKNLLSILNIINRNGWVTIWKSYWATELFLFFFFWVEIPVHVNGYFRRKVFKQSGDIIYLYISYLTSCRGKLSPPPQSIHFVHIKPVIDMINQ